MNMWGGPLPDIVWYRWMFMTGRGIGGGLAYISNANKLVGSSEILCSDLDGSFLVFWAHRVVCNVKLKDDGGS